MAWLVTKERQLIDMLHSDTIFRTLCFVMAMHGSMPRLRTVQGTAWELEWLHC